MYKPEPMGELADVFLRIAPSAKLQPESSLRPDTCAYYILGTFAGTHCSQQRLAGHLLAAGKRMTMLWYGRLSNMGQCGSWPGTPGGHPCGQTCG